MSIDRAISSIRLRFLAETEKRRNLLCESRRMFVQPVALEPNLTDVHFAAHKTCGVASTVGYRRMGQCAQALDAALIPYVGRTFTGPLPMQIIKLIDELVAEMNAALDREGSAH